MHEKRHYNRAWVLVAAIGLIIGLSGGYAFKTKYDDAVAAAVRADRAGARADIAEENTEIVAEQAEGPVDTLLEVCAREGEVAELLQSRGDCTEAENAREVIEEAPSPPPGPQGPPPSFGVVLSAVVRALPAALEEACGGPCNGENGEDGEQGEQGPGPTLEQIRAAVVAALPAVLRDVCGGSCNGTDGTDGEDAEPAREIVSVSCEAQGVLVTNFEFTYRYSDGTQETVVCSTSVP